jgi:hypothetical protein
MSVRTFAKGAHQCHPSEAGSIGFANDKHLHCSKHIPRAELATEIGDDSSPINFALSERFLH